MPPDWGRALMLPKSLCCWVMGSTSTLAYSYLWLLKTYVLEKLWITKQMLLRAGNPTGLSMNTPGRRLAAS